VADVIEQFSGNWLSSLKDKTHKEMLAHRIRREQEAVIKLPMADIPVDFSLNPSHADGFPSDVLRPLLDRAGKNVSLLLSVDEAHKLRGTPGDDENANLVLKDLHENPRIRAMAIFAGHSHTPDTLYPSISKRYADDNEQPMKPLAPEESNDYILGTLDELKLGGSTKNKSRLATWICGECSNWPHHLRNAMKAVAKTALMADSPNPSKWDAAVLTASFQKSRVRYYEQRLRGPMKQYRDLAAEVFSRLKENHPQEEDEGIQSCKRAISAYCKEEPERKEELIEDGITTGKKLHDHLLSQGVIARTHPDDDNLYEVSTPCLRTYAVNRIYEFSQPFPDFAYSSLR